MRSTFILFPYYIALALANCNPIKSTTACPADPALSSSFIETFANNSSPYFTVLKNAGDVSFGNDGISLSIKERFDNPTIQSNFYIMFGKVEVVLQAAQGQGIVSSFYLQSDALDEIDIELFGGDPYEFQSNYFVKGDTSSYNRGGYHPVSSNPLENYHTYTLDWTEDSLTWSLDGTVVRVLNSNDPQGYPQTPMQVIAGIWAGGDPSNAEGTIEWAGGVTDYSKAPFTMHIKSVIVADYSSGRTYSYENQSGNWTSIESEGGQIDGRQQEATEEFYVLKNGGSVNANESSFSFNTVSRTANNPTPLATAGPSVSVDSNGAHSPYPTYDTAVQVTQTVSSQTGQGKGKDVSSSSSRTTYPSVFIRTAPNSFTTVNPSQALPTQYSAGQQGPSFANHPITGPASEYSSFENSKPTFTKSSSNFGVGNIADASGLGFIAIVLSMMFF